MLDVIDEVVESKPQPFCFGPSTQRCGEAKGECRLICIFCHAVHTRTGDLRFHLHKTHNFDREHIGQIFDNNDSRRMRVFGQYSYDDVKLNKWNIQKWKQRRSRGSQSAEGNSFITPSSKRKNRHETPDASLALQRSTLEAAPPSMKRQRRMRNSAQTPTASYTLFYDDSSTVPSPWPDVDFERSPLEPPLEMPWPADDHLSLASDVTLNSEILAQVGTAPQVQDVFSAHSTDNPSNIDLSSNTPFTESPAGV